MSAMLTADWFLLGRDTYYRKLEVCPMEWQQKVNLENVVCCGAQYGGPVSVVRDRRKYVKVQQQPTKKPNSAVHIYTGAGRHVATVDVSGASRAQLVTLGWSDREELLCVLDDGMVAMYDMSGAYRHSFSIGQKWQNAGARIAEARVFGSPLGTGVAVMTAGNHRVSLVNNVHEPKERRMSELPAADRPPTCWAVVSGERHNEVLVARGRDLYLLREDDQPCLSLVLDIAHPHAGVLEMAVSLNARHVALYTDAGHVWLGSVDLRTKYCEVPVVCVEDEAGGAAAATTITTSRQLTWCGTEAVVLHSGPNVTVVGKRAQVFSYMYDGPVCLVAEIDGVRVLSATQHEMLQKVPDMVQKIFRINSTDPGSFLLEASKQYQKRSHRADEYICLVKRDLRLAVRQCIEAAGHEFDPDVQKMLIRAAQFGKCSLADSDADTDLFVNMCRTLRVLNAVRAPNVGIPLTYGQLRELTHAGLLERLVARRHHCLAIEIARYLRLPEDQGSTRILLHWAKLKVTQTSHLDEETVANQIAQKLSRDAGGCVSFAEVTRTAVECGRKRLAVLLLEHEPRATRQVPLLLQLDEMHQALVRAIESGDTDLMYTVILRMHDKMPVADFRLTVRNFPVAQALYKKFCREHSRRTLAAIQTQEDDFAGQAADSLRESLDPSNTLTRESCLFAAQAAYRKAKNELHASLCEEAQRLLKAQRLLQDARGPDAAPLVGLSVHDTCAALLAVNDVKAADKLRADFRVPDRRYLWLRIRALARLGRWADLERLSRTRKSPVPSAPGGLGPFVDVCLEQGAHDEALKYLARLPDDLKVKYYVKAGMHDEAAQAALAQKDPDALLYVQRRCPTNKTLTDKINSYMTQLNTRHR